VRILLLLQYEAAVHRYLVYPTRPNAVVVVCGCVHRALRAKHIESLFNVDRNDRTVGHAHCKVAQALFEKPPTFAR